MSKFLDLTGHTFGRLTVLSLADRKNGRIAWTCTCTCGATVSVQANNLRSGNSTSCGCANREVHRARMAELGRMPNRTKPDDEIGYTAAHDRVRKVNGSASLHSCVDCGVKAQDWSLKAGAEKARPAGGIGTGSRCLISPDPTDYEPRCKKCHAAQDGHGGWGWRHGRRSA
ncbi:MAG: hypothetical protein IPK24_22430 [Kineosporiaceae bacterium]|nr:hypothetical protein [Kineosporiaceae bacterium]